MASRNNPTTWDQYERGGHSRTGSVSSVGNRSVQFEETESLLGRSLESHDGEWPHLRRRRSSITNRLTAITDIGGVNSIRSFTRSWQRAAGFTEVIPQRPAFIFAPEQEPSSADNVITYDRSDVDTERGSAGRPSLLQQHFEAAGSPEIVDQTIREESPEASASSRQVSGTDYREREAKALEHELNLPLLRVPSHSSISGASIFAVPPHLATPPIIGSYGSNFDYGTVRSNVSRTSMAQAAALWQQQQETGANVPDGELAPILIKEVEQDGKIVLAVEGQSTLPQTVFNSTNVLIGVGLLSLPMGMKYAGWILGMSSLFMCAAVTAYTAKLLAKCMDLDPSLITFSDLAFISFGRNARIATSVLFTLELLAACVALIVLFADSLHLLLPGMLSVTGWKFVCSLILIPLNFLPLRLLSFTSILGIFSCLSIVVIILLDGFIKPTTPGSLLEPAKTYMWPENWLTLPLSFGLLMSPWGGHSVFPNIYRDMRHPYKYEKAVKYSFSFTYILDTVVAVAGLLMFGDGVRDEITSNILMETGYPRALTVLMCVFVAVIPLTKVPLNTRPIVSTIEVLLGLHQQTVADNAGLVGRSMYFRGIMKVFIRVAVILVFLAIAIVFPAFDSIMAFMGSALCFTICVTLPLAFYLKLFGQEISAKERLFATSVMIISTFLSVIGTVFAFLPKSLIGAERAGPTEMFR
ncbi:vacuolar amino acid transporter 1 [Podospora fimiseda]|uniref:Vacuolar amino acid transporter 1 n=1 Tax=Podospora fimiseda TaxID=252190 RepID=A0AAN7BHY6_9PEZI|nr:vacuolar amino acid transporter 1 [Podospora fimiseda]